MLHTIKNLAVEDCHQGNQIDQIAKSLGPDIIALFMIIDRNIGRIIPIYSPRFPSFWKTSSYNLLRNISILPTTQHDFRKNGPDSLNGLI